MLLRRFNTGSRKKKTFSKFYFIHKVFCKVFFTDVLLFLTIKPTLTGTLRKSITGQQTCHTSNTRMGHEQIGETTTEAGTDEPQVNLLFWQNDHSRLEHLILAMNVTWFPE